MHVASKRNGKHSYKLLSYDIRMRCIGHLWYVGAELWSTVLGCCYGDGETQEDWRCSDRRGTRAGQEQEERLQEERTGVWPSPQ